MVLFVADLFHPVHDLAVELFLNGDMRHGGGWRGAMPVLLAWREPDHVAGPDFFDRASPALRPAATRRHDQGLTQRMGVPRGSGTGLEGDTGAGRACRAFAWNNGSIRTVPVNQSAGPLLEGCEPLLLISIFNFLYFVFFASCSRTYIAARSATGHLLQLFRDTARLAP